MSARTPLTILRIASLVIFIAAVSITLLFAEGYRYDLQHNNVVKKGVVYFKDGLEDGVTVHLDGVPITMDTTHDVSLLPGNHTIEITKDGYFPWKKSVAITTEKIVQFPQIRLLKLEKAAQEGDEFIKTLGISTALSMQSFSDKGVFFLNKKLHFGSFYPLTAQPKYWLTDVVIPSTFTQIIPLDKNRLLSVTEPDHHVVVRPFVSPQIKKVKTDFINAPAPIISIKAIGDRFFGLDTAGRVYELFPETNEAHLFFNVTDPVTSITQIHGAHSWLSFLLKTKKDNLLVVASDDGSIVFQEGGVSSAFLDLNDSLYFTKDKTLFVYSLDEKKIEASHALTAPVVWLSRIGTTYQFLFLMKDHTLLYCDEEFENCHPLTKIQDEWIASSKDMTIFMTQRGGQLISLDFAVNSFFPELLQNLVSFSF